MMYLEDSPLDDYDKKIHGDVSKYGNKDSLEVFIKWNDKEETIVLNKVEK